MKFQFRIFVLILALFIAQPGRSAETPRSWDITLGTLHSSVDFFSASAVGTNALFFGGSIGRLIDAHIEPILGFNISFYDSKTFSDVHYSVQPGIAYNFSEDSSNSWVMHLSAAFFGGSNVRTTTVNSDAKTAEVDLSLGRRIPLFKQITWYPRAYISVDDGPSTLGAGVIPFSLSILL